MENEWETVVNKKRLRKEESVRNKRQEVCHLAVSFPPFLFLSLCARPRAATPLRLHSTKVHRER